MKKFFFLLIPLFLIAPLWLTAQPWVQMNSLGAAGSWSGIVRNPADSQKIIAFNRDEIFVGPPSGPWKELWRGQKVSRLVTSKEDPGFIFALTDEGVFRIGLESRESKQVYHGKNSRENEALSFALLPDDPDHWFLGTQDGLLESDDAGQTWFHFSGFLARHPVSVLKFVFGRFFAASGNKLYLSYDLTNFTPVFSMSRFTGFRDPDDTESGIEVSTEGGSASDGDDEDILRIPDRIHDLIVSNHPESVLWLATDEGVFQSEDKGLHWVAVSTTGLSGRKITRLVYSESSRCLFASGPKGVFTFQNGRWKELFQGMTDKNILDLILFEPEDGPEELIAVTKQGVMHYPLDPVVVETVPFSETPLETMNLFHRLIQLEPSARELHKAVIRYADLGSGKIKRWHTASRLRTLLPDLSFGKDFSRNNNVDIDRGGTNDADRFIMGPEDVDKGWNVDVSWDLGDLIWSSSQTSIDSREKLMVELRNDVLAEATRVYYERKRLQTEILFRPAPSELEHSQNLLRMDELTSLLDSMSNGYFSKRIEKIYREYPELAELWAFHNNTTEHKSTGSQVHKS